MRVATAHHVGILTRLIAPSESTTLKLMAGRKKTLDDPTCAPRDDTPDNVFVTLCDWRGRITWANRETKYVKVGDPITSNISEESQQEATTLLSRVVTMRETRSIEVTNRQGERVRCWMWPLDSPDVAVCLLSVKIPAELGRLTAREKECLELLAQAAATRDIADKLDISLNTVHTHLKRAREKLGLPNVEALIGFAARYCFPPLKSLVQADADSRGHLANDLRSAEGDL